MGRELILAMSMSTDGFVSGPNGEIDWVFRHSGEASAQWAAERLGEASLIAMGHRSYQGMADYWPTADGPFAGPMNEIPKAAFSRGGAIAPPALTKEDPRVGPTVWEGWRNPLVAGKDLTADIQRLKAEDGGPIVAIGGAAFAASLIAARLVDAFRLAVFPVVLGRGVSIFAGMEAPIDLELVELKTFETGTMVKTFRSAQPTSASA